MVWYGMVCCCLLSSYTRHHASYHVTSVLRSAPITPRQRDLRDQLELPSLHTCPPPAADDPATRTLDRSMVRCGEGLCGVILPRAVRCGAVRCGAVRCGAVRCGAVRCGAVLISSNYMCIQSEYDCDRYVDHDCSLMFPAPEGIKGVPRNGGRK